jgi:hypothetical protein
MVRQIHPQWKSFILEDRNFRLISICFTSSDKLDAQKSFTPRLTKVKKFVVMNVQKKTPLHNDEGSFFLRASLCKAPSQLKNHYVETI